MHMIEPARPIRSFVAWEEREKEKNDAKLFTIIIRGVRIPRSLLEVGHHLVTSVN